jgi:hypothetical protein
MALPVKKKLGYTGTEAEQRKERRNAGRSVTSLLLDDPGEYRYAAL